MPPREPLTPARLDFTEDGTPYSDAFGDIYHSTDGGPGQARLVFLGGNDLPARWQGRDSFTILETGFGTGLNFLATWAAWRQDARGSRTLHYLAVEKHPFTANDLVHLHERWPELADLARELRTAWPTLTPGFHRLHLEGGRLHLTLLLGDAAVVLPRLSAQVDAIYLDGFAPQKNPDMWTESLFRRLARLAMPGATLSTWSVAAGVREGLQAQGFHCEKRPGFGRKREMLTARYAPQAGALDLTVTQPAGERHALVIGAGLAGSAACARLAARGWRITLIERHDGPAAEASGNLAGVMRPLLSLDDNIASRYTRAAYLYGLQGWRTMQPAPRWADCGVLQIGRDEAHEAHQREIIDAHRYPEDYAVFLDRAAASERMHWPLAHGGWFFPGGGWANPPSVCAANLAACADRLSVKYACDVASLEQREGLWHALDGDGHRIAAAPVAILASGADAHRLAPHGHLPVKRVRGQVTHIPALALPPIDSVICREGYLAPPVDGLVCAGASYDFETSYQPDPQADLGNLARLDHILPGATSGIDAAALGQRVGFRCVPPDRLPIVGALPNGITDGLDREAGLADIPRHAGLYGLLGLASRGLVWSQLAAELLASRISGEPLPVERDLADALDPTRFMLRRLRRGRPL